MPRGVPVATVAIGKAGAANAGVLAAQIVALTATDVSERLRHYKAETGFRRRESREPCRAMAETGA